MRSRTRKRSGFAIMDLAVFLAVLGLLAGIVPTAVLKAREADKRGTCVNNLKQLGLALHIFHDGNMYFPTEQNGKGVYEQLLPYVEEQNADPNKPKPIKLFMCPDRRKPTAPYRDYVYVHDNKQVDSPILYEKKGASLTVITNANGASNTALLAHIWMDPNTYANDKATWADKTHQVKSAANKLDARANANNVDSPRRSAAEDKTAIRPPANVTGLGSPHKPGNPYLFADGHVRAIPYGWNKPKGIQNWIWNWKNANAIQFP